MANNKTQIPLNSVFSTPFYKTNMGFENSREHLRDYLMACETDEFQHKDSPQKAHKSVFESQFDLLNWPDPIIQTFKQRLYEHLMNYIAIVSGFDASALHKLNFNAESWFHITRSGGYFQPHTHPLASVSLIYCVDPGDKIIENEHEAGKVMFSDPRYGASMFLDPVNRHMQRTFSFDGVKFRLMPDEVCIFPSYLQHSVEPYVGAKARITIAANFSFHLNS